MKTQLEQLRKVSDPELLKRMESFKHMISNAPDQFVRNYYPLIVCDSEENRWRKERTKLEMMKRGI